MAIDTETLASLAAACASGMTSIRGRRVQRLVRREFAGADEVRLLQGEAGPATVLGLSASGAAICATDGRGRQACVLMWRHGSEQAVEIAFDLLKDSLPVLARRTRPLAAAAGDAVLRATVAFVDRRTVKTR